MRHLPNLLTLANLFCGCCAIAMVLSAQPFSITPDYETYFDVPGVEQPWWGTVFIFAAAVFDLLDGAAARALKIHSPIGKDLDSLADLVSFGVAPAAIVYKLLWTAWMRQPEALDVSLWATAPAFALALFAALRLARFNVSPKIKTGGFQGLPTPAAGLAVAALPLVPFYGPPALASLLLSPWVLYLLVAVICWLMISKLPFFKLMPAAWSLSAAWPSYLLVAATAVAIPLLKGGTLLFAVLFYALLSFFAPKPRAGNDIDAMLSEAQP